MREEEKEREVGKKGDRETERWGRGNIPTSGCRREWYARKESGEDDRRNKEVGGRERNRLKDK